MANSIRQSQTVVEVCPSHALRHLSQQTFVRYKILSGADYPVPLTVRYNSYLLDIDLRNRISRVVTPSID
ncbi:MAG: hypothetical protein KUF72_07300 [Candidatus Thiodiazotropha sp. (ex Ctena orbiculata)]|nr:hypothetical protein [Candidatus Thiodiazotropha taylori]